MSAALRFSLAVFSAFALSAVENVKILTALFIVILLFFLGLHFRHRQLQQAIKFLLIFNIFTFFIWLTLPWKWQDGWHYSAEGQQLALLLSLKMNLITLFIRLLLHRFNELDLLTVLQHPFVPPKFVRLALLSVRYIKIFAETDRTLSTAMRARGFHAGFNRRTFYVTAQRVALLLIHAMNKAEIVDMALRARGVNYQKINVHKEHQG